MGIYQYKIIFHTYHTEVYTFLSQQDSVISLVNFQGLINSEQLSYLYVDLCKRFVNESIFTIMILPTCNAT